MVAWFWQRAQLQSVVMIAAWERWVRFLLSYSGITRLTSDKRLFVRHRRGCSENPRIQVIFSEFICAFVAFPKGSGCFRWNLKRHLLMEPNPRLNLVLSQRTEIVCFVINSATLEVNFNINRCWQGNRSLSLHVGKFCFLSWRRPTEAQTGWMAPSFCLIILSCERPKRNSL